MLEYFPVVRAGYRAAGRTQERLSRRLLDWKKDALVSLKDKPEGYLLGYEMNPVYTCGRRQIGHISPKEREFLTCNGRAEFVEALRGGHTTFHGPGQLVMYPVVDLKRLGLTVRDYVCSLEKGIIEVMQNKYGIVNARRIDGETGVWLDKDRKIASIGIHVRRNVTSHGISVNVNMDPFWFGRIVACNLPDARLVSMADKDVLGSAFTGSLSSVGSDMASELARRWSVELNMHSDAESLELLEDSQLEVFNASPA